MKRGQVSIFIIVGIVILLAVGLVLVAKNMNYENTTNPDLKINSAPSLFPVEKYIEYCIEREGIKSIQKISKNGGSFLNKGIHYDEGRYIVNWNSVSKELEEEILINIDSCINITDYENQGYDVVDGDKEVFVNIGQLDVLIKLNYNLSLTKNNFVINKKEFNGNIKIPLGKFIEDSREIVNLELREHRFNLDNYRLRNRGFEIYRISNYPEVKYIIHHKISNTNFSFIIKELDTRGIKFSNFETQFRESLNPNRGACVFGESCYDYTDFESCDKLDGFFYKEEICNDELEQTSRDSFNYAKANGFNLENSCKGYFDITTGEFLENELRNGESVCAYEKGVGGRHYKLYCDQGQVITDSCRDYKEEICVENKLEVEGKIVKSSECVPNRFIDCTTCDTEECCNNSELRDCFWEDGCYPIEEPAFDFWNFESSIEICNNYEKEGDLTNDAKNCFMQGDCGNKNNFFGDYLDNGFLERNFISNDFYEALDNKQEDAIQNHNWTSSFVDIFNIDYTQEKRSNFDILDKYFLEIENLILYEKEDFLDPQFNLEEADLGITCDPWKPVSNGDCSLCNVDNFLDGETDFRTCTEYKCRSLGENCLFEIKGEVPICSNIDGEEKDLNLEGRANNRTFIENVGVFGKEIEIIEPIKKFEDINIEIESDEEIVCKMGFLPGDNYENVKGKEISNHIYLKNHNVSFNLHYNLDLFSDIQTYFKVNEFRDIMDKLILLRYEFDSYQNEFPTTNRYSLGIYPILRPLVDYYLEVDKQRQLDILFAEIDEDIHYLFLYCADRSGNIDDIAIKFRPEKSCEDDSEPEILEGEFKENKIEIRVNEISECKYDIIDLPYELMFYNLTCEQNQYEFDEGYLCETDFNETVESIFVKCADHPEYEENEIILKSIEGELVDTKIINYEINESSKTLEVSYNGNELAYIDFGTSYTCKDYSCNSKACVIDYFEGNISCERKKDECASYNRNIMSDSFKLDKTTEDKLEIVHIDLKDNKINLELNLDAYCGVKGRQEIGFIEMKNDETIFWYDFGYDVESAEIVCYRNGHVLKENIN